MDGYGPNQTALASSTATYPATSVNFPQTCIDTVP